MQLKSLSIRRRDSWEAEKGFTGSLTTTSPESEITIRLSDESCREIIEVASKGIRQAAAETATFLANEAQSLTLEAPKELA